MSLAHLKTRAAALAKARRFFSERNVLEVDSPALVPFAPIDSNIDVLSVNLSDDTRAYLHTSPEYAMKKLLADGAPDIYFLGHVYRKGELGRRHNPEFTMAEWYRHNFTLSQMIEETATFLSLFLGSLPLQILTYQEAFLTYTGIDPFATNLKELQSKAANASWDAQTCIHYLLSHQIEPHLGQDKLTALTDYPPKEAALAQTVQRGPHLVAERFEIYHQGVELANGYHELSNAPELRARFIEENRIRASQNKETYLLDESFLTAMEKGLPPCSGVSVGFDRALMLQTQEKELKTVLVRD